MSFGLQQSSQAVNTTLSYTNTADAWLTTASWSPANNWNNGAVKTNVTTADVRLNIGTNVTQAVTVTYNATMGTTIFDNTSVSTRGLLIGSGSSTTGAVTIASGALVIRNGSTADSLLVGAPAASGAGKGTLTLSGGNLTFTNGSGNGFGVMCVAYRGGSTIGGANFAQGVFTIGGGSTATIERTFFGFTASEANAQCTGIINLNAGGTLSTRNVSAAQRRIYALRAQPFRELDDWLERYRSLWEDQFGRLDQVLEELQAAQKSKKEKTKTRRRR